MNYWVIEEGEEEEKEEEEEERGGGGATRRVKFAAGTLIKFSPTLVQLSPYPRH